MYKFKIRNMEIDLSEPTQEAFDKFWDMVFLNMFLEKLKPQIKEELQLLIDTQNWEYVEDDISNSIDREEVL